MQIRFALLGITVDMVNPAVGLMVFDVDIITCRVAGWTVTYKGGIKNVCSYNKVDLIMRM